MSKKSITKDTGLSAAIHNRYLKIAGIGLLATTAYVFYLSVCLNTFRLIPLDSDFSNLVLEASDILSGNVFLSGWVQTGISFLTTDLVFFIIGAAIRGVSSDAYFLAVASMYAALSVVALLLLKWKDWKANALNVIIWIGIGAIPLGELRSSARAHAAVYIYVFLAALFAEKLFRSPRKLAYCVVIASMIALGTMSDALMILCGVLPLLAVCLYLWISGQSEHNRFSLSLALSAATGFVCGIVMDKLYYTIGGADKNSFLSRQSFREAGHLIDGITNYVSSTLLLFDADVMGKSIIDPMTIYHGVRLLVVLFGIFVVVNNIVRFLKKKNDDILSVVLSVGFVVVSAVCILTTLGYSTATARYLCYFPLLFSVLIGRYFSRVKVISTVSAGKHSGNTPVFFTVLAYFAVLVVSLFYFRPVEPWANKTADTVYKTLGDTLVENNLKYGFSAFWDASVTTVTSGGKVKVRAIQSPDNESLQPYYWFCKKEWYKPDYANFIVLTDDTTRNFNITKENIEKLLGEPQKVLDVEHLSVYIYDRDISEELTGVWE